MERRVASCELTSASGFTLIELMLAVALSLVLIVGINYVFQMTSDAVGAGQTVNAFARDSQSAQAVLFDDFRNIDKDAPCFIIASQLVTQFLNSADAQTGSDPNVIVIDSSGNYDAIGAQPSYKTVAPQAILSPAVLNYRCHRADLVKFFAHGFFPRRSANDGSYTSPTTATDAFVTLGHALLPTNDGSVYVGPTSDTVSANSHFVQPSTASAANWWLPQPVTTAGPQQRLGAYAADWVLARSVMLLKDPTTNPGNAEHNYSHLPTATLPLPALFPYAADLTPLGHYSPDDQGLTISQLSRYDLANVTPDQLRRYIADEILQWRTGPAVLHPYMGPHLWWNPLVYNLAAYENAGDGPYPTNASPPVYYFANTSATPPTAAPPTYLLGFWTAASGAMTTPAGATADLARVACNPQIQSPLNSASIAQMAPYFLQHCSQFIVEYAGDYLQQDGPTSSTPGTLTGEITGLGPDGQIDYVIVTDNANPPHRYKKIRWYGMPRSSNGGTANTSAQFSWDAVNYPVNKPGIVIRGYNPGTDVSTAVYHDASGNPHGIMEEFVDVIPLRDYYSLYLNTAHAGYTPPATATYQPPWEVDVNFDPTVDYGGTTTTGHAPIAFANGVNNAFHINDTAAPQNNARYAAAWYNDMPAMIRILIKVDDPNDKLKDGPWYEYIFRLK